MNGSDAIQLNFPQCLAEDFAEELPGAVDAVDSVLEKIDPTRLGPLSERSPALRECDWPAYLRCSVARMVHARAALRRSGLHGGRVLDYGSYFGNFSLMFARAGFSVDAADSYRSYGAAFDDIRRLLADVGGRTLEFSDIGYHLERLDPDQYDVVLCMGVIEHIPNTPRLMLRALDRVLRPGGMLIIDTPNIAYLYNRQKMWRGESVMPGLEAQYHSGIPFEGHHREYTLQELIWMLRQLGHVDVSVEAFNYSAYALNLLQGRDAANHWVMVKDPSLREVIMSTSRKPVAVGEQPAVAAVADIDWRECLVDPETTWVRALPDTLPHGSIDPGYAQEAAVKRLQEEVALRDELLQRTQDHLQGELTRIHDHLQHEITVRDRLLRELSNRIVASPLADADQKGPDSCGDSILQRVRRLFE
jgi:2-polyprenyl-3-methyl-5-hydroxy-6-metoxy-1,4-benzoquinol methylase